MRAQHRAHGCQRPTPDLRRPAARRRRATPQRRRRRAARRGARPGPGAAAGGAAPRWSSWAPTAPACWRRRARRVALGCYVLGRGRRSTTGCSATPSGSGAETVAGLPESETWLVELLTDVGDGGAAPGVTIGVLGGCGWCRRHGVRRGAGAGWRPRSARRCSSTPTPSGPASTACSGSSRADGIRWDSMLQTTGRLSSRSLREALPRTGMLSVLTWPTDRPASLQAFAMREVLSAGRRGFDVVVVDLPRHHDAVVEETITRCDHVVLVSTLTVPGRDARRRGSRAGCPSSVRERHLVTRGSRAGVDARVGEPAAPDARCWPRWATSAGSTRRSTSAPDRPARVAAPSPGPRGRARSLVRARPVGSRHDAKRDPGRAARRRTRTAGA